MHRGPRGLGCCFAAPMGWRWCLFSDVVEGVAICVVYCASRLVGEWCYGMSDVGRGDVILLLTIRRRGCAGFQVCELSLAGAFGVEHSHNVPENGLVDNHRGTCIILKL
ncbi:hypothetical protein K458DRAFT_43630 [Lentithecium fluviatile CBS 122367]|uniref:Uncharacterized protein n=1 Tax=Lentithecium fluviatile CBS 122367 TaxID=1168545 RepID=A0A6G1J042_9PLEO|nr:hypothetical protein K458DRAFT_43630 [Lentithecium fluviatile CBS 122367]